jgi:YD repeat-containing protein
MHDLPVDSRGCPMRRRVLRRRPRHGGKNHPVNRPSQAQNHSGRRVDFCRLLQGDEQFEYDANGNQTRKTTPGTVVDYVFDRRNRMVEVTDSAAGLRMQFDYDADGNRLARRVRIGAGDEIETQFVVDRSFGLPEVIAELDGDDTVTARRAMSRTQARRRYTVADHAAATAGIECRKDEDVIDETPMAYKSIEAVMHAQRDLVEIVHTLRQVVCVKG